MSHSKISVCVTTYNHENYIGDCITSIIQQNVAAEIEILVGNDHSTDETTKIITELARKHGNRIRHFHRDKNIGAVENLKLLVNETRGDYIAHIDGDDYWQPGKLQAQLNFMSHNTGCAACYTNAWVVHNDLSPLGVFNGSLPTMFDLRFLLKKGNFLNHSSLFYRAEHKDILLDCPGSYIDYRIHIGLAMRGMLGFLNAPYVTYRYASSQSAIRHSNQRVRIMYFEALLYAFESNRVDDVYETAFGDFFARIVKDGVSMASPSFLMFWFRKFRTNIRKARMEILLLGLFGGFVRLFSTVMRKICTSLKGGIEMKVIHER